LAGPTPGTDASSAIVLGRRAAISASVELWKTTYAGISSDFDRCSRQRLRAT